MRAPSKVHLRRGLGGLEESLSANLALDAHGFLVLEFGVSVGRNVDV